jgi:hypothetical protein
MCFFAFLTIILNSITHCSRLFKVLKDSKNGKKPLRVLILKEKMVGLGGLEPPTSPLSGLLYILWGTVG